MCTLSTPLSALHRYHHTKIRSYHTDFSVIGGRKGHRSKRKSARTWQIFLSAATCLPHATPHGACATTEYHVSLPCTPACKILRLQCRQQCRQSAHVSTLLLPLNINVLRAKVQNADKNTNIGRRVRARGNTCVCVCVCVCVYWQTRARARKHHVHTMQRRMHKSAFNVIKTRVMKENA